MKKLIKSLKLMKKKGISAVKQSLEDEGATFRDIVIMREITKAAKAIVNKNKNKINKLILNFNI